MKTPDYYDVLQLSPLADLEVIQAAYKRLAFKYHPDRNHKDAEWMMPLLNEAYETLSDPVRRRTYDQDRGKSDTNSETQRAVNKAVSYVHGILNTGETPQRVIELLIAQGLDHATAAEIVDFVVKDRQARGVDRTTVHSDSLPWWDCPKCFTRYQAPENDSVVCPNCGTRTYTWSGIFGIGAGIILSLGVVGWILWSLFSGWGHSSKPAPAVAPPQPKTMLRGTDMPSRLDRGTFSHDLILTNAGQGLRDVRVSVRMYDDAGKTMDVEKFWGEWKTGSIQKINLPAKNYQKHEVRGTALRGAETIHIDLIWTIPPAR